MAVGIAELRARALELIEAAVPDVVPGHAYRRAPMTGELAEQPTQGRGREASRRVLVRARPPSTHRSQGSCFVVVQQLAVQLRYDAKAITAKDRLEVLEDMAYSDQPRLMAALLAPGHTTFGTGATADIFDAIEFVGASQLTESEGQPDVFVAELLFELEYRLGAS